MAWYDRIGLAIGGNNYNDSLDLSGIYKDGWVPDGGTYSDGFGNTVQTPDLSGEKFNLSADRFSDIMDNARMDGLGGTSSIFGNKGVLPTMFQGLSALGGLMQAYTGFKGLQLAKEQLNNAKDAFRTQFDANKTALGDQARNASATNYAMHNGLAGSFNQAEQNRVADAERDRVKNSYKSYV